jgi:carbamoyl-phosphate synthase small subunit
VESRQPFVEAFVVREASVISSNWRSGQTLEQYLKQYNIIGLEGIDTRTLTRHIRLQGAMKAVISTEDLNAKSLVKKAKESPSLVGRDLVKEVASKQIKKWNDEGRYNVVAIDTGVKYNILRLLVQRDCKVTVVPAQTRAEEISKLKPDGIMLANGPGDPAAVTYVIETVRKLIGKYPIFGICLGQQMLGLAMGGKTFKLKFGHHGANHPVMDLKTGKVHITVQNHGFCVDIDSLNKDDVEITHINLNDRTLEGLRHKKLPIFSVQFHPEASPGPHDARYLFDEFVEMMERNRA